MGIETSCDETGVGFVQDGVLLGDALVMRKMLGERGTQS